MQKDKRKWAQNSYVVNCNEDKDTVVIEFTIPVVWFTSFFACSLTYNVLLFSIQVSK